MTVGKLASGIAHELGLPLNVVSARAQMIASGEATPAEAHDYARVIVEASERMTRIIRQLMAFARRKPADKAPRDVRRLATEVLELLRPLADKKDVRMELHCEEREPTAVVDGAEIQQALTNLVVNAMQAMPKGGSIDVGITHAKARAPGSDDVSPYLCVSVKDHGQGIAPDHLPHVFEPFFTTKDVGEGTGLGLSVTHGIVQDHGGWIGVESEAERGTVFSVYLRLVRPLGAKAEVPVDVRIVTASNRDLEAAIDEKRFREDLYYRVNVIHIPLPPLRARGGDVLPLALHFVRRFAEQSRKSVRGFTQEVAERLAAYAWPGNVRELQNSMERAVALARFEELCVDDLPDKIRDYRFSHVIVAGNDPTELVPLEEVERRYILRVVDAVAGNKTAAARVLGMERKTLYRKLERYAGERNGAKTPGVPPK